MIKYLIAILFMIACFEVDAKTIKNHPGGDVMGTVIEMDFLEDKKEPIIIDGNCSSACTIFLGAKDVCVTENAVFKFHQAQKGVGDRDKAMPSPNGSMILMSLYSQKLRDWIRFNGGLPWQGMLILDDVKAVELGIVDYCK